MNLSTFFSSKIVALPRSGFVEGRATFDQFLKETLDAYADVVSSLDDPDFPYICSEIRQSESALKHLSNRVVTAVSHYLKGYPYLAYNDVQDALATLGIEKLFSTLSGSVSYRSFGGDLEFWSECFFRPPLYRIRADLAPTAVRQLLPRDIFHVPFEHRRRVRNQRYSIAGLPCLYLGSSIWICWEELNRPDLDGVWVSRFRLFEDVKVLDFQFPPILAWHVFQEIRKRLMASNAPPKELSDRFDERFIVSYILFWPLIAACSICVDSPEGAFFPQHIVPQILLQWVGQERKVDGIRYFSTRTSPEQMDGFAHWNCVFPAREITASGQCAYLRRKFSLTSPIAWDLLQTVEIREQYFGASNAQAAVGLSKDFVVFYSNTDFFKAEAKLGVIESRASNLLPGS